MRSYNINKDHSVTLCKEGEPSNKWISEDGHGFNDDAIVKQEVVGEHWVSTAFLGMDHNHYTVDDKPHLFETMIKHKDGEWLDYQYRYSTWDEAEVGHNQAVQWVKDGFKK